MGKRKGNQGERDVADILYAWWSPLEPTVADGKALEFVRMPMSGAWAFGPAFSMCGDVVTNAQRFPFSVEVKRQEAWSMEWLLAGRPSPVWKFWRQCQRDARKAQREPMLWFRQNRKPWLVMLRKRYAAGISGMEPPFAAWPNRLRRVVDCEALPVLYTGERLVTHLPDLFAKKVA